MTWTADAGAGLAPGQYQTFSISAGPMPENADSLAFPALQGYDDGSVVAWIDPTVEGQAEPEHPAPTLRLAAPTGDSAATAPAASSTDGGTSGLAVTALIVGLVGLLVGAAGVVLALGSRRRAAAPVASAVRERDTVSVDHPLWPVLTPRERVRLNRRPGSADWPGSAVSPIRLPRRCRRRGSSTPCITGPRLMR